MSLALDDEMKSLINNATVSGAPIVLATVDGQGRPRLSFRGSLQVFSEDRIGFWARKADGTTMNNIAANPNVAMMYRNPSTRVMLQLNGRARLAEGEERAQVYDNAPDFERNADPDKKGVGVMVDIDAVEGFLGMSAEGKPRFVRLVRGA